MNLFLIALSPFILVAVIALVDVFFLKTKIRKNKLLEMFSDI